MLENLVSFQIMHPYKTLKIYQLSTQKNRSKDALKPDQKCNGSGPIINVGQSHGGSIINVGKREIFIYFVKNIGG